MLPQMRDKVWLITVFLWFNEYEVGSCHDVLLKYGSGKSDIRTLQSTNCSNLPDNIQRKIVSLNVTGLCARFYAEPNCEGDHIEVIRQVSHLGDLSKWKFQNKIVSVGPCPDECSFENIGHSSDQKEDSAVHIHKKGRCSGKSVVLDVDGCTKIPSDLNDRYMSLDAVKTCVELYTNDGCRRSETGKIQIRRGHPLSCTLPQWNLGKILAISRCNFHCPKVEEKVDETTVSDFDAATTFDYPMETDYEEFTKHDKSTESRTTDASPTGQSTSVTTNMEGSTTNSLGLSSEPSKAQLDGHYVSSELPTTVLGTANAFSNLGEATADSVASISRDDAANPSVSNSTGGYIIIFVFSVAVSAMVFFLYLRKRVNIIAQVS